jgi:AraC-like DNA-binding protein
MVIYNFQSEKAFTYRWCGKFQSPSPDWMHLTRCLTDFELIVVTEGTLYIANSSTEYVVSKGQYLLMGLTDCQHGYKASDCSFYWLHYTYNKNLNNPQVYRQEDYIPSYREGHLLIPETDSLSSSERIIVLMKQLQDSDKRYHELNLNSFLTSAILAEISDQSFLYKKHGENKQQKQLYNDICDFITLHVSENITMDGLAAYFNYNKKYLTTFFRKQSGNTIKHFILQTKMDYAKAELTDTNHSISQISYNIGFNDVHNFSNAFKKITGLSPSDYRSSFSKRNLNNK